MHAEDVVTEFSGYRWGTNATEIPELNGVTGKLRNGLLLYATILRVFFVRTEVQFLFDPADGGLAEGRYLVPTTLEDGENRYEIVERTIIERYPELHILRTPHAPTASELQSYGNRCGWYLATADRNDWQTVLINLKTGRAEIAIAMKVNSDRPGQPLSVVAWVQGGRGLFAATGRP